MPIDILAAQVHHYLHPGVTFCKEQAWQLGYSKSKHPVYPVLPVHAMVIVQP